GRSLLHAARGRTARLRRTALARAVPAGPRAVPAQPAPRRADRGRRGRRGDAMSGALAGRHALVTGGGRGIGAAIASALAAEGARITLLGRDRAVLERHAGTLPERA